MSNSINYKNATFVCGTTSVSYALKQLQYPEIAVYGRSNVGKSSIINAITECKGLCRKSMKPGCTMQLNYFLIDDKLMIVDMPGYGFARRSKVEIGKSYNIARNYIANSTSLKALLLLIDIRRGCKENDIEMIKLLCEEGRRFVIVFTKGDKVCEEAREHARLNLESILKEHGLDEGIGEATIVTSSKKGKNISALRELISEVI
ncbi:putative GTP-binding protein EngB [Candidatus Fokinia solitaria]|uniref:Probable GTP-binding protein EngB n=1 Tax=Candidatus Fokinia solitaria TaxID=1802984 RepID=A0A2U8BRI1_9RICK|nr:ribosome biogenesis GTP-binding protein YihA/YsxC [Candidatus Fokinia solitaria]AWD32903.1 putative GTP-binding protein EngB [Candidatus Fokinia solitaria]